MKIILLTLLSLTTSCATLKQHSTIGVIAGAVGGALLGYGIPAPNKNQTKSIVFGASLGTGFGWLIGKISDQTSQPAPSHKLESNEEIIHELPDLSQPTIKRIWIPDQIEGDQYIKGHYIYVIEQKPFWKKNHEPKDPEIDSKLRTNGKNKLMDQPNKSKD